MPTTAYSESLTAASRRPPTEPAFHPGLLLQNTYRIEQRLAIGGMGEVYAAKHERLPVRVAVKVLHRDSLLSPEALGRFGREAAIMAGLHHPHITHVHEFNVTEDGTPYLVMELLEGRNLQDFVDQHEPVDPGRMATIIRQIGSALDAAHAQGVVHRDLKPENVMLMSAKGHDAFVKVFDFGISKLRGSNRLTRESTYMGTPEYMSPEQAEGQPHAVDHRTDQFALAALAYALLTGRQPFTGEHPLGVIYQVINHHPPALATTVSWPAHAADKILRKGMAKRPEDRFADVWTFACALAEALAQAAAAKPRRVRGTRAIASWGSWSATATHRRIRNRRAITAAVSATLFATGVTAALVLASGGPQNLATQAAHMWRAIPNMIGSAREHLPALATPTRRLEPAIGAVVVEQAHAPMDLVVAPPTSTAMAAAAPAAAESPTAAAPAAAERTTAAAPEVLGDD
jgi:hypothetical protein